MRWSLVLSAFITVQSVLSFVCVALPIPPQSDELLERRAPADFKLKLPSKTYRENSKSHPFAYEVKGLGPGGKLTDHATVSKKELKPAERYNYGDGKLNKNKRIKNGPSLHADHVFEAQMLDHHLKKYNIKGLHPDLQKKVKEILNGPENMAIIPGSINQSKGQLIKHGMEGNKIKSNKVRNDYALKSYGTAHQTAKKLDEALKDHPGYTAAVGNNNLQQKLKNTFIDAGLPLRQGNYKSYKASKLSSGSQNSRQSTPRPSTPGPSMPTTPGPSSSSHNQGSTSLKRPLQASPGNSKSPPRKRGG